MVAMMAPMQAREVAQVSSGLVQQGDGSFAIPRDCGNIVIESSECELSEIKEECHHVSMC